MQLTHSGRFSKPEGPPDPMTPIIILIWIKQKIDENIMPVDDDYIESLEEKFEEAVVLAYKAGFDGVDIKSCHRYLNSNCWPDTQEKASMAEPLKTELVFF